MKTQSSSLVGSFYLRLLLAFSPIGMLLLFQSLPWPKNWDDMHRGFNGISHLHDPFAYGWIQSKQMLKLLVHDPLLTWSNQFDFRFPILSGITESLLLMSFMGLTCGIALRSGRRILAYTIIIVFNLFIGLQASTFLPPAAYPLSFTAMFLCTVLGSLCFDTRRHPYGRHTAGRSFPRIGIVASILLCISEQIAFLFYACNFLQSFVFWLLSSMRAIALDAIASKSLNPKQYTSILFSGARYVPFMIASVIWRSSHGINEAESFSDSTHWFFVIINVIRWNMAGTSLGGSAGMQPASVSPWDQPLWIQASAIIFSLIVLFIAKLTTSKPFPFNAHKYNPSSGNDYSVLAMLGLSIVVGWSLPSLSERYYQELSSLPTQTYVASRYASLGFLLLISIAITFLAYKLRPKTWVGTFSIVLMGYYATTQNVAAIAQGLNADSLKLSDICNGAATWNKDLLPKEVFGPGINTNNWITTFPESSIDQKLGKKRLTAINIFERNSRKFCR